MVTYKHLVLLWLLFRPISAQFRLDTYAVTAVCLCSIVVCVCVCYRRMYYLPLLPLFPTYVNNYGSLHSFCFPKQRKLEDLGVVMGFSLRAVSSVPPL